MTHLYIMGFQFNPTGTYELAASVLSLSAGNQDEGLVGLPAAFTTNVVGNAGVDLTGPQMLIDTIGSQLAYLKVGIVITLIVDPASGYPATGNTATTFEYSGVYMPYSLWNTAQPIIQDTAADNRRYYGLLTARHQIYGLSSFWITTLDARITVVNYDLTVGPGSSLTFRTDDVNNMNNVRVSADQWSNLAINICPSPNLLPAQLIVSKVLSTVPTMQNNQQTIYETSSDLSFNYFTKGSDSVSDPTLAFSTSVTYSNILNFEQIVVGAPYRLDFSFILDATFPISTSTAATA